VLNNGQTARIIEATSPYEVKKYPTTRAKDNLFLRYEVDYQILNGNNNIETKSTCAYFAVTRC
jgi:hypothetical protein